jgi:hypothetical protein
MRRATYWAPGFCLLALALGCGSGGPRPPGAPQHVTATGGRGSVTVTWDAVPGAASYTVYWSASPTVNTATATSLVVGTPPLVHSGLTGGTRYYYVVVASNSGGAGAPSDEVSALASLAVPANASAEGELGGIRVRWDAVAGAGSYRLYWSDTSQLDLGSANQISVNDSQYLDGGLPSGTTRYYVVTAVNGQEEPPPSATLSATVPQVTAVSARYPVNGAGWNDYLANDGTSAFTASDAPCVSTTGGYRTCLHGGEMRQAEVVGQTDCDGITAEDSAGALQWSCVPGTGGAAPRMVSTGLREERFLSDLIDFDAVTWKNLSLRIRKDGRTVAVTSPAAWCANPVVQANEGGSLTNLGTVYVVSSASAAAGYFIGADRVALVTKPGLVVRGNGTGSVVSSGYENPWSFLWIEGEYDATGGLSTPYAGIYSPYGRFKVLRGVRVRGPDVGMNYAILYGGSNGKVEYVTVAGGPGTMVGIGIVNSTEVVLSHALLSQGGEIFIADSSRISGWNVTAFAVGAGLTLQSTHHSAMSSVMAANGYDGVSLLHASDNTLWRVAAAGNTLNGIIASGDAQGPTERNQFADIAAPGNSVAGITFDHVSNNRVSGQLVVGATRTCSVLGGNSPGLIDSTCTDSGADGSYTYTGQASDAVLRTGRSVLGTFVGGVVADDPENASDYLGKALYSNISDWTHFSSPYRGWGRDGDLLANGTAGSCTDGEICRIWDWSLHSSDTVLRRAVGSSPRLLTHSWARSATPYLQAECDATHRGSIASGNECVGIFLVGAIEREGDGIGNDDGLCESGETCIAAPNFGAYQGHGALRDAGTVTVGSFSARLLEYEENGY